MPCWPGCPAASRTSTSRSPTPGSRSGSRRRQRPISTTGRPWSRPTSMGCCTPCGRCCPARDEGHVVLIGSVAGDHPYPGGNVYGGTKAFLKQFALNLRADLLGANVRVTNIEPGMTETEFALVRFKGDAAKANAPYRGVTPMSPEEVAETVFWSCTLPRHVNINRLQLMPVQQAFGPLAFHRR